MKLLCKVYKITTPLNPTRKQLEALLFSFYSDAAVIKTDNGCELLRTDKKTTGYDVEFSISGYYCLKAESEDAARSWVEDYIYITFDRELNEYECYELLDVEIKGINASDDENSYNNEADHNNQMLLF